MSCKAKANHSCGSQGKPNSRFHPHATKNGCKRKQCAPPITLFVPTFIAGLPLTESPQDYFVATPGCMSLKPYLCGWLWFIRALTGTGPADRRLTENQRFS